MKCFVKTELLLISDDLRAASFNRILTIWLTDNLIWACERKLGTHREINAKVPLIQALNDNIWATIGRLQLHLAALRCKCLELKSVMQVAKKKQKKHGVQFHWIHSVWKKIFWDITGQLAECLFERKHMITLHLRHIRYWLPQCPHMLLAVCEISHCFSVCWLQRNWERIRNKRKKTTVSSFSSLVRE